MQRVALKYLLIGLSMLSSTSSWGLDAIEAIWKTQVLPENLSFTFENTIEARTVHAFGGLRFSHAKGEFKMAPPLFKFSYVIANQNYDGTEFKLEEEYGFDGRLYYRRNSDNIHVSKNPEKFHFNYTNNLALYKAFEFIIPLGKGAAPFMKLELPDVWNRLAERNTITGSELTTRGEHLKYAVTLSPEQGFYPTKWSAWPMKEDGTILEDQKRTMEVNKFSTFKTNGGELRIPTEVTVTSAIREKPLIIYKHTIDPASIDVSKQDPSAFAINIKSANTLNDSDEGVQIPLDTLK